MTMSEARSRGLRSGILHSLRVYMCRSWGILCIRRGRIWCDVTRYIRLSIYIFSKCFLMILKITYA